MLVFVAGAAFNVVFAFLLACVVWLVGQPTSAELNTTKIGLVLPDDHPARRIERAQPGIRGRLSAPATSSGPSMATAVTNWPDLQQTLFASGGRTADGRPKAVFTVDRGGRTLELTVYPRLAGDDRMRHIGIAPAEELVVCAVKPGSARRHQIGLKPGDRIVA